MNPAPFLVDVPSDGMDLVSFLEQKLKVSKRRAKALLDQRCVFVNRRRVWMARHVLRRNDRVEVAVAPQATTKASSPRPLLVKDDLVVAEKPAGWLANGPASAELFLRERLADPRIVAVHRLDRDTSGCLLLARTPEMETRLTDLFKDREMEKHYEAIARGHLSPRSRTLRHPLEGKTAQTHIDVLDANATASHLRLRIETGRTHQIRKHLAGIRHAVVGDTVYGPKREEDPRLRAAPRQMLHAGFLRFRHPVSGETVSVRAPLPPDFRRMLRQLRLR